MAEIHLVRLPDARVSDQERLVAQQVLCGKVDGLGEINRRRWRRFLRRLFDLEPGEIVEIRTHQERIGWYHRKHMALEQAVYEQQERFEKFESFRIWLKIGSGFVDWYPGPRGGGVVPVAKSISYSRLEQGEMEQVHGDMVEFLRSEHAQRVLWPHLSEPGRMEMMEAILMGFGE